MTTSGTTTFSMDLGDIIEEAYARVGKEVRTGWEFRTARISLNILFTEWANQGVNLWTLDSGQIPLVAGTSTYTLPVDTVDLLDHVIRTGAGNVATQADLTITRISEPTYSSIPNKLQQARPIQVWVQRLEIPQVTVWPVPDNSQPYVFVYWRLRRIQDAGSGANTPDVPFRFLSALISGLAYYLAMKTPEAMDRLPMLKQQYAEAWQLAADEDREKAAIRFVPRQQFIGSY